MSTDQWSSVRIMSTHGARIDCIAQLASDDRAYLESRVGRVAVCNRCAGPTKCAICALGGAVVLAGIRDAEWYPRDPADDSTNGVYVFTMLSVWRSSDRHYSKSR